jgi:hypothetical protein
MYRVENFQSSSFLFEFVRQLVCFSSYCTMCGIEKALRHWQLGGGGDGMDPGFPL